MNTLYDASSFPFVGPYFNSWLIDFFQSCFGSTDCFHNTSIKAKKRNGFFVHGIFSSESVINPFPPTSGKDLNKG